ncbi:WS/DGAT/MGAT family O-acyltransferase [Halopseudomonas maritima]|uniref:WS/DGAT/MGAT family O-acyltransferase n=1 Tax=Halopseudomonas maritima TaxID=2918528 RepID=UPI001EEAB868|nr:wax ester/triacylglycerol synthase family O-acyltransferase [Halopseudomonas maritima]UJJ33076.1 wax ester/triacylglycerol synthase family O-acyltransferase [Halopseudomonas maritima]
MEHLSNTDAAFLHMETPETPMHVGSLMLLDVPTDYDDDYYEAVKRMIAERMHLSAVLTRKLAPMPFELAEPVWITDNDIDLDYHIRSLRLRKPGSHEQLEQLVARLHSSLLDRSRPLWEMYVIEGLQSGQIAFYTKAHHSRIDGQAGAELARLLYDLAPEGRVISPPVRQRRDNGYQLGMAELLQAAVLNSARKYRTLATLLPTATKAIGSAGKTVLSQRKLKGARSLSLGLAPRSVFNDSVTNQRSYAAMHLPFEDIKRLGKQVGGTVNTVVMAMCSDALRRYLQARDQLPADSLIAGVPVSIRDPNDKSMNNQVSMVRVDLATDTQDFAKRFRAIHDSSEAAKAVVRELRPVMGLDIPVFGSPWLMTSLASMYGRSRAARRMPPIINVAISNVPGPQQALYIAGLRITNFYPVSIPYHGCALNITVQSYAGNLEFGLTACRRVVSQPEVQEMVGYLREALEEIEKLQPEQSEATDEPASPAAKQAPRKPKARPRKVAATRTLDASS